MMVMMVLMLVLVLVIVVMMVVMVVAALLAGLVMMSAIGADAGCFEQFFLKARLLFHRLQNEFAGKFIPGSCNKNCLVIVLTDQFNSFFKLLLADILGTAQDNGLGVLDLIVEEFTEILHIHLAF